MDNTIIWEYTSGRLLIIRRIGLAKHAVISVVGSVGRCLSGLKALVKCFSRIGKGVFYLFLASIISAQNSG